MNKTLRAIFVILLIYFIGEAISHLFLHILPGSVIEMVLLFIALQLKIVKEEWISSLVDVIMKNLPLLFLAPSLGILTIFSSIKDDIFAICVAVIISLVGVIISVGFLVDKFTKK